uniref:Uncharacterized protein n=1 Tax=Timema poppense TaxID=170557 RepID=A0A7R9HB65_TIMPO|nr:unnamed protein product [Timema poppensis]
MKGIGDHMVLALVKPIYSCLLLRVKDEIRFSAECDKVPKGLLHLTIQTQHAFQTALPTIMALNIVLKGWK